VDQSIAEGLVEYVEQGIRADTDIVEQVMRRAIDRHRPFRTRFRWTVVGAVAAAAFASAVAVAAATGNLSLKVGPSATTLAGAEQAFGAHVFTARADSGAVLYAVYFWPATPRPANAEPGSQPARNEVELAYSYARSRVDVTEVLDPTTEALNVDALGPGGAKLKAAGGLGAVTIEAVNGSEYVVGRSVDGSVVEWIIWKSSTRVVVTTHFGPGLTHDLAFALAATFR
jgi:hypothetical protein